MRSIFLKTTLRTAALAGALLTAGVSQAADIYLQAESFDKELPGASGPIMVPMWGFASCTDATFTSCASVDVDAPGPQINLTTADSLTIHVNNTLSTPVSIVIPGQAGGGNPTFSTDGLGVALRRRHMRTQFHMRTQ